MPLSISITVDASQAKQKLEKLDPALRQRTYQKLLETARYVQQKAIGYAYEGAKYSRSGQLRKAIVIRSSGARNEVRVVADSRIAKHVRPVAHGQRPHEIPRNPAWGMIGRTHPGARGKFFMERAAVDARLVAPRQVREGVRLAIKDSGFRQK